MKNIIDDMKTLKARKLLELERARSIFVGKDYSWAVSFSRRHPVLMQFLEKRKVNLELDIIKLTNAIKSYETEVA